MPSRNVRSPETRPPSAWSQAPLPTERMQEIAAENNLSETAFIDVGAGTNADPLHLRWFTPTVEVDLCGHATLGLGVRVAERGRAPADVRPVHDPQRDPDGRARRRRRAADGPAHLASAARRRRPARPAVQRGQAAAARRGARGDGLLRGGRNRRRRARRRARSRRRRGAGDQPLPDGGGRQRTRRPSTSCRASSRRRTASTKIR